MPPAFPSVQSTQNDSQKTFNDEKSCDAVPVSKLPLSEKKITKRRLIGRCLSIFTRIYDVLERKTPLWTKLGLITIPALVGLVGLAIFLFVDSAIRVDASKKVEFAIESSMILQDFISEIQEERAVFSSYVITNGAHFGDQLEHEATTSDASILKLNPLLQSLERRSLQAQVETLKYLTRGLADKRKYFIDNAVALDRKEVVEHYVILFNAALSVKKSLQKEAMNHTGALSKCVTLMKQSIDLLRIKDVIAERRSMLSPIIAHNSWQLNSTFDPTSNDYNLYKDFVETIVREERLKAEYFSMISQGDVERYTTLISPSKVPLIAFQDSVLQDVTVHPHPVLNVTSPEIWHSLSADVLEKLSQLDDELTERLISTNFEYYVENIVRLVISVLLICFFVIPTIVMELFICRMIYKPVIAQKKNLMIALELSEAIINLNFNSHIVQQLKQKIEKNCSPLEKAFRQILENFQSFIPYIPRHLLLRDEVPDQNEKELDDAASVCTVDSSHSGTKSQHSKKSQPTSTTTSGSRSSSSKRRRLVRKVSRKTSTIMCIDLNEFSRGASEMNFALLQSTYAEYLSTITEMLNKNNGVILSFSGGVILCSWGAASRVFDMEVKAATMALDLIRSTFSNPKLSFRLKVGIATSECTVGELGNNEMRAFNVIGTAANRAVQLAKLCKHYKCAVLVDKNTFKNVNFSFDVKQVDSVNFDENGIPHESIFSVVQSKGVTENEWMYTMEDSKKKDMFAKFNEAWTDVIRGDFVKARVALNDFKSAMDGLSSDALIRCSSGVGHLDKIISRGEEDSKFRYKSFCHTFQIKDNVE